MPELRRLVIGVDASSEDLLVSVKLVSAVSHSRRHESST